MSSDPFFINLSGAGTCSPLVRNPEERSSKETLPLPQAAAHAPPKNTLSQGHHSLPPQIDRQRSNNTIVQNNNNKNKNKALRWKKQTPPTPTDLYTRIKDIELMEKMTARLQDRLETHDKVWEDWHRREDPP